MLVNMGRTFIGRLEKGADILKSLTEICKKENIRSGAFSLIGAVTSANVGYYDQLAKKYCDPISFNEALEITACTGNVSIKDNGIFVHAHISLSNKIGKCFGGHLMPGTYVFAAEYCITEFMGEELVREFDDETGLGLWKMM
ncbi:MAG: DNA-binding protein [Candidatus Aureabacteria bacterium]|nr:DNA-binding protein [Candidatus Auribacterota bacterium]